MGMFDNITCEYKLPVSEANDGRVFQTKDLDNLMLDDFKIDKDGQLWVEEYDMEDQSDPNAEGIERFWGCMTRVNQRWTKRNDSGSVYFYTFYNDTNTNPQGWMEFEAVFDNGVVKSINTIEFRKDG